MVNHGSWGALDLLTKGLWNMDSALYLCLCLTAVLASSVQLSEGRRVSVSDLEGLMAFKHSADRGGVLDYSWAFVTAGGPCGNASIPPWLGIGCNHRGRVDSVQLSGMQLNGSFAERTLGRVSELRHLALANNSLQGPLPRDLVKLKRLLQFSAQQNNFTGPFPQLCRRIRLVDLSGNDLHGRLPSQPNVTMADPGPNQFQGNNCALPKNLQTLNVSGNSLTGIIPPDLGCLSNLRVLDLSRNQFHRGIPGTLPENLETLNLSNNSLVGNIPSDLSALTNLVVLDLSSNQLQGNISSNLSALTNLVVLDLSGNQLQGNIPSNLTALTNLEVLDVRGNQLKGSVPSTLSALTKLVALDLSANQLEGNMSALPTNLLSVNLSGNSFLTGSIPPQLLDLSNLSVLDLSGNSFYGDVPTLASSVQVLNVSDNELTGYIPTYLSGLMDLTVLDLSNNQMQGQIPALPSSLETLDLSDNLLSGNVPTALSQRFPPASFAGNAGLCGPPTTTACPAPPTPAPAAAASAGIAGKKKKLSSFQVGIIAAGAIYFTLLIFILARFSVAKRKRRAVGKRPPGKLRGKRDLGESSGMSSSLERSKEVQFVIVDEERHSFDLSDLLRASAEILGRAGIGTSYKTVLESGSVVVVKRLRDVRISELKEFNQHMKMLGRLKHPNLVPLTAYCFTSDDKLLIHEFMPKGSLFSLLHGNRGPDRKPLEWPTRLNIALGVAQGLAFLHRKCQPLNIPHGNLKSSNVLMGENFEVKIADFGLVPLVTSTAAAHQMAGCQAPECKNAKKLTLKADVYSFGVLLLELLTGRQPALCATGEGIDLPQWVRSVTKEKWTGEVLDLELKTHLDEEDRMVSLLQIAMVCAMSRPEKRPEMAEVLELIEAIDTSMRPDSSVESYDSFQLSEKSKAGSNEVTPNEVMDILREFWLPSSDNHGLRRMTLGRVTRLGVAVITVAFLVCLRNLVLLWEWETPPLVNEFGR